MVHPVFTGAVALLAVNDQLLKTYVGGPVVGKLSDVAGVVLLAWSLGVVTRRPAASSVVVALAFAALKTVPGVAELAAPVLGGATLRDPTDLVALLALVPSTAVLRRTLAAGGAALPERPRSLLAIPAVVLAVLAVTATSCAQAPLLTDLRVNGNQVWVQQNGVIVGEQTSAAPTTAPAPPGATSSGTAGLLSAAPSSTRQPWESGQWAVSGDAGATWTEREPTAAPGGAPATRQACAPDVGCFRVDGGRLVEHRARESDPWRTTFAFTSEQERRLALRNNGRCNGDANRFELDRVAIARTGAGPVVLVSANSEGLLRRAPDGTWSRVAVIDCRPTRLSGPSWVSSLVFLPITLLAYSLVLVVLAGVRRRWSWSTAAGVAALGGIGVLAFTFVLAIMSIDYLAQGVTSLVLSVGVFVASLVVGRSGEPDVPPSPRPPPGPLPPGPPPPGPPPPGVPSSGAQPPQRS
ncbi:hypothetical protein FB554_0164 [Barrientosiimonas humi]|uniref:Uncharacterized protein n=2 Tax=Barrientosiimonas humi TaxID=999931 RepID=A0A542X8A9_9MICO|nr:hypothetical protein FB554_0164 [Barrientosiimonas humi]CAG7571988.1 hypothetical protein BH39T_PBIAJDOK_00648 [Barrientosiimonas humi]